MAVLCNGCYNPIFSEPVPDEIFDDEVVLWKFTCPVCRNNELRTSREGFHFENYSCTKCGGVERVKVEDTWPDQEVPECPVCENNISERSNEPF